MSDDLRSLLNEAEKLYEKSQWDASLDLYKRVLAQDPANEDACYKSAAIYAIRGLIPDLVDQYFKLMDIFENAGDLEQALEVATWILKVQPDNDQARLKSILIYKKKNNVAAVVFHSMQLARLYVELGRGDESIMLLRSAQEASPENLDISLELAEVYMSHGHINDAANLYRQVADQYLARNDVEKALEAFRRIKVIVSDDPRLLLTLGNLYYIMGRYNDAEVEYRSVLRLDLGNTEALMALGNVCRSKGQFRDAILAFTKILSIDPQEVRAKEMLAELFHAQGNHTEAIKNYLSAASIYQSMEETPKAVRLYQRVISLDPTNPTACRELSNLSAPLEPDNEDEAAFKFRPQIPGLDDNFVYVSDPHASPEPSKSPETFRESSEIVAPQTFADSPSSDFNDNFEVATQGNFGSDSFAEVSDESKKELPHSSKLSSGEESYKKKSNVDSSTKPKSKDASKKDASKKDKSNTSRLIPKDSAAVSGGKLIPKSSSKKSKASKPVMSDQPQEEAGTVKSPLLRAKGGGKKVKPTLSSTPKKQLFSRSSDVDSSEIDTSSSLFGKKGTRSARSSIELPNENWKEQSKLSDMESVALPSLEEPSVSSPNSESIGDFNMPSFEMSEMPSFSADPRASFGDGELSGIDISGFASQPFEGAANIPDIPSFSDIASTAGITPEPEKVSFETPQFPDSPQSAPPYAEPFLHSPAELQDQPFSPESSFVPEFAANLQHSSFDPSPMPSQLESGEVNQPFYMQGNDSSAMPEAFDSSFVNSPQGMEFADNSSSAPFETPSFMEPSFNEKSGFSMQTEQAQESYVSMEAPPMQDMPSFDTPPSFDSTAFDMPSFENSSFEMPSFDAPGMQDVSMENQTAVSEPDGVSFDMPIQSEGNSSAFGGTSSMSLPFSSGEETPQPFASDSPISFDQSGLNFSEGPGNSFVQDTSSGQISETFEPFTSQMGDVPVFASDTPDFASLQDFPEQVDVFPSSGEPVFGENIQSDGDSSIFEPGDVPIFSLSTPSSTEEDVFGSGVFGNLDPFALGQDSSGTGDLFSPFGGDSEGDVPIFAASQHKLIDFSADDPNQAVPGSQAQLMSEEPPAAEPQLQESSNGEETAVPPINGGESKEGFVFSGEVSTQSEDISVSLREKLSAGELAGAIDLFNKLLADKPDDIEHRIQLADLLYENGLEEEASQNYKFLTQEQPNNIDFLIRLMTVALWKNDLVIAEGSMLRIAKIYAESGEVSLAQEYYQSILAINSDSIEAREELIEIYRKQGMEKAALYHTNLIGRISIDKIEPQKALSLFRKIYEQTSSPEIHIKLAEIYERLNMTEEAVASYRELLEDYRSKGDLDKISFFLEKLKKLVPEETAIYEALSDVYQELGDKGRLLENKTDLAAHLVSLGDVIKAIDVYTEILENDVNYHPARKALIETALDAGSYDKAFENVKFLASQADYAESAEESVAFLTRLLELWDEKIEVRQTLIEQFKKSGENVKAVAELSILAEEFKSMERNQEAVNAYEDIINLEPENKKARFELASLYRVLNEELKALENYEKNFTLDPVYEENTACYVDVLLNIGEPEKAMHIMNQLIEMDSSYNAFRDKVVQDYKNKVESSGDDLQLRFYLGVVYKELGLIDDAIEQFQKTKRSPELSVPSSIRLAQCFGKKRGMQSIARKTLMKTLEEPNITDSDKNELKYALAGVYEAAGKKKEALELYNELDPDFKDTVSRIAQLESN